jgi:hypothetical protein
MLHHPTATSATAFLPRASAIVSNCMTGREGLDGVGLALMPTSVAISWPSVTNAMVVLAMEITRYVRAPSLRNVDFAVDLH